MTLGAGSSEMPKLWGEDKERGKVMKRNNKSAKSGIKKP
jgi:hypothetical protein